MGFIETYERLYGSRPVQGREKAFRSETAGRNGGVLTVTTQLQPADLVADDFLLHLSGDLVGADAPNGNGQMWSSDDLRYGLPTVQHGPLNWLHNDEKIIGCITGAQLVEPDREQAAAGAVSHISADSTLWRFLFPDQARVVAWAAEEGNLYYSMECISREVECAGSNGCGHRMTYKASLHRDQTCCEHIRDRAAARRLVDPIFQGAAVIVPPKSPGWDKAVLNVVKRQGENTLAGAILNAS